MSTTVTMEEDFILDQRSNEVPDKNRIPPITDPMGKHWDQPDPEAFLVDDTHAVMSERDFKALRDYSHSQPTGTYPGKMWRRRNGGSWWLCWFGHDPDPAFVSNNYREILIA